MRPSSANANNRSLSVSPSRDHIAGGYVDDNLPQLNDSNNPLFIKIKARYYDNKTLVTKFFNRVPMSMRRSLLVKVAFRKATSHGEEFILIKDILKKFHPQVYENKKQLGQALHWFIQDFKEMIKDSEKIYFDQFEKYYKYLSCFIENDNVFEKVIVDVIKVDGNDTINFMKGVKVSFSNNDETNFNPTISYSELPSPGPIINFASHPSPSSSQQNPKSQVKFTIPEEDDALSYFDQTNSPLKGGNSSKQPPEESYYSNGNYNNGNKSNRNKQVGISPLCSSKPPLAQPPLGTPQFIPKAPSQHSPRSSSSNVNSVRMQSPNTYNNSNGNGNFQNPETSLPSNPEIMSSGMLQRLQEQMQSMQTSFSLGVEEMNKLKEIEIQCQQQINYYKAQLQASMNENAALHNQNEDMKKQINKLKGQFKSVFVSYEALLALQEQSQLTIQHQNNALKKQADEIKNLVSIN